jgi:hypothetical protein
MPPMPPTVDNRPTWQNTWRYVAAVGGCLLLAWFPFVRHARVPLLGLVDLGSHELGHLVTYWLPDVITAMMGSGAQIAVPLGLALYFLFRRHDRAAAGLCLAWAATNCYDASVYIADAPFERLQLIGGEHDWAFVLGPDHFNALDKAGTIATAVVWMGALLLLAGLAVSLSGLATGGLGRPSAAADGSLVRQDRPAW